MKVTDRPHLHRNWIDPHAFGIVKALQKRGHTTYLVGGCVRDLLLGLVPKDYDIGTTAQPDQVQGIIYKSYVIGKRFRLVLVKRGLQQYEVATFRREVREDETSEELPPGDNLFGSPEEDANRRDFTVNGLFYDPVKDSLIDFANGLVDLDDRWIRMIGKPEPRLQEDPIRILRALRFAHKLQFSIEPSLRRGIESQAETLLGSALPRRREEWLKLLRLKYPLPAFLEAFDLGLLRHISPQLHKILENPEQREIFCRSLSCFHNTTLNPSDPTELFGAFTQAFVRAQMTEDPLKPLRSRDYLENEALNHWMREELGMFKAEQTAAIKALLMQPILARREEFERRGEKRRLAVLRNEGFKLGLKLALRDHSLSASDWHFWYSLYWKHSSSLPTTPVKARRKRRRRPRRDENSTRPSANASAAGLPATERE